jgi:hypothetical protein
VRSARKRRDTRAALATNLATAISVLTRLPWDRSDAVRAAVAANPRLPEGSLHGLRTDPAPAVAAAARVASTARRHTPRPARAAGGDLLQAIEALRDPEYREIAGKLAAKGERAERRQQARDDREAAAAQPFIDWINAAKRGETVLDFSVWLAARTAA